MSQDGAPDPYDDVREFVKKWSIPGAKNNPRLEYQKKILADPAIARMLDELVSPLMRPSKTRVEHSGKMYGMPLAAVAKWTTLAIEFDLVPVMVTYEGMGGERLSYMDLVMIQAPLWAAYRVTAEFLYDAQEGMPERVVQDAASQLAHQIEDMKRHAPRREIWDGDEL